MDRNTRIFIVNLSLSLVVFVLHVLVIIIIHKARLRDNRYFLVKILSIFDAAYNLLTVSVSIPFLLLPISQVTILLVDSLNVCLYTSHAMALQTTILISIDRYLAVDYGLNYHEIVTKKKLLLILSFFFIIDLLVNLALLIWTEAKENLYRTSNALMICFLLLRIFTCFIIIISGKCALKRRQSNERRLQRNIPSFPNETHFREQAEKLDRLKVLKASIKDVIVLNFWTVLFLLPLIVVGFIEIMFDFNKYGSVIVLMIVADNFSNPIVYMLSQSQILKYIRKSIFPCFGRVENLRNTEKGRENKRYV